MPESREALSQEAMASDSRSRLSAAGRVFRIAAYASLGGIAYSVWQAMTAGGESPILYLFFWLPVFAGLAIVLFLSSHFLIAAPDSATAIVVRSRTRLTLLVDCLLGSGAIALVVEGIVIAGEGKRTQAIELALLAGAVVTFRLVMRGMNPQAQHTVNIVTIAILVLLAVFWFPVLQLILSIFDVA